MTMILMAQPRYAGSGSLELGGARRCGCCAYTNGNVRFLVCDIFG